jgi:hypothetical protein
MLSTASSAASLVLVVVVPVVVVVVVCVVTVLDVIVVVGPTAFSGWVRDRVRVTQQACEAKHCAYTIMSDGVIWLTKKKGGGGV